MKIAIIGAGFTGLSAAYRLQQKGNDVTVFEKAAKPGGLALGFQKPQWDWTLEEYYHHWFTNDDSVLNLAKEINYPVIIKRPITSAYIEDHIYQLDSPLKLLQFPKLSLFERFRMAAALAMLRYNPNWKPLEKYKTSDVLPKLMGKRAYEILWKPQMQNKFGTFSNDISLAWFWARISKRTTSLAYPEGGFLKFSETLARKFIDLGGKITYNVAIEKLGTEKNIVSLGKFGSFDKVIVTLPSFAFVKLCPQLPQEYKQKLTNLKGLGAQVMVLRLKEQFFNDNTYWLSVCDTTSPILAIVEHTNFMDKKHYNNEHLLYVGNYLPQGHEYFSLSPEQLLKRFDPFLKKLNPQYKKNIIGTDVFNVPFAQPIIPTNYSKMIPPFETPLNNVYLANIQQVYPWDRGTNYAVELGEKIADIVTK
ncbi:MAG TPA: FAD-dependent oxidoreductase [Candidatus Saccharimonadales bacterium]|nr:FAD-dependent oxidoreductase [Candidatus Saccharimonadales bacterium]